MNKDKKTNEEIEIKKAKLHKIFSGVVVSDKMDKTVTVKVSRTKTHPKYKKIYASDQKYKVHDEKNQYKEGDKVNFMECRPMSKDKKWRVIYQTANEK